MRIAMIGRITPADGIYIDSNDTFDNLMNY